MVSIFMSALQKLVRNALVSRAAAVAQPELVRAKHAVSSPATALDGVDIVYASPPTELDIDVDVDVDPNGLVATLLFCWPPPPVLKFVSVLRCVVSAIEFCTPLSITGAVYVYTGRDAPLHSDPTQLTVTSFDKPSTLPIYWLITMFHDSMTLSMTVSRVRVYTLIVIVIFVLFYF
jgi:hypothetical protein